MIPFNCGATVSSEVDFDCGATTVSSEVDFEVSSKIIKEF